MPAGLLEGLDRLEMEEDVDRILARNGMATGLLVVGFVAVVVARNGLATAIRDMHLVARNMAGLGLATVVARIGVLADSE